MCPKIGNVGYTRLIQKFTLSFLLIWMLTDIDPSNITISPFLAYGQQSEGSAVSNQQEIEKAVIDAVATTNSALIAATASIIGVIFTGIYGYGKQKQLQDRLSKSNKELEELRGKIQTRFAKDQAYIEYRYHALKNLYEKCDPALFQLIELSKGGLIAIRNLAENSKMGMPDQIPDTGRFMRETVYRLFAPLAAFRFMQSQLTLVDINLNELRHFQYNIGSILYNSLSEHVEIASCEPRIEYEPRVKRQGLDISKLEIVIFELFLQKNDKDEIVGIKSMAEFIEAAFHYEDINVSRPKEKIPIVTDLFRNFSPATHPVLWRILIVHAYLYEALILTSELKAKEIDGEAKEIDGEAKEIDGEAKEIDRFTWLKRHFETLEGFDWHEPNSPIKFEDVFESPFRGAEHYLRDRIDSFPAKEEFIIEKEIQEKLKQKFQVSTITVQPLKGGPPL
jgi:hypothetical protein